uniref:Uncharacterized protein n=1 Tax=Haliea sp. ETY-M TaxID=1055105 RepID=A0A455R058_9GAMM|nr:hypothetical protein [Haliea sp. ETY-M]
MGITTDEIFAAIEAAAPADKLATAARMLRLYDDDDKENIKPWIYEYAALGQCAGPRRAGFPCA